MEYPRSPLPSYGFTKRRFGGGADPGPEVVVNETPFTSVAADNASVTGVVVCKPPLTKGNAGHKLRRH